MVHQDHPSFVILMLLELMVKLIDPFLLIFLIQCQPNYHFLFLLVDLKQHLI